MIEDDEWRPVREADGRYEISSRGRLRSYAKSGGGKGAVARRVAEPTLLTHSSLSNSGYALVCLRIGGKTVRRYVHRLVATAFHGDPPPERPYVNHKDGERLNNCDTNLEWVSQLENMRHARDVLGRVSRRARINPSSRTTKTFHPLGGP